MQTQYAAQVAADLETNRKEQEHVRAEVTALQEQLQTLENDHAVLLSMQQALVSSPAAPAKATAKAPAKASARKKGVPAPRAGADKSGAARAKKAATTGTKAKAAKSAPKTTAKKATTAAASKKSDAPAAGPTLVELIAAHLGQQKEPRSAAEITTALAKSHPDRAIKTTVVRTTVEGLVAKGRALRTKQGSSVFYTAAAPAASTAAPKSEAVAG
ncbi:hypothetical protein [Streptomyces sp. NPDC059900]|uniref:hypothetical protein n=1 Tax=Streptomyces sp. NPDC059900 TaxID=3155816 RepID=UPI003D038E07